jgi:hypothetical protein
VRITGIPVLDEEEKASGVPNTNHEIYLQVGPLYIQAAKQVLRYYPVAYVRSILIAWFAYFRPPTDFFQFEENLQPIRTLDRTYNLLLFGQWREASGKELRGLRAQGGAMSLVLYTGALLLIAIPVILLATVYFLVRDYLRQGAFSNRAALTVFILVQIVMLALIVNFLSSFENNRYRFPSDPLYIALLGGLLARAFQRSRPARSGEALD